MKRKRIGKINKAAIKEAVELGVGAGAGLIGANIISSTVTPMLGANATATYPGYVKAGVGLILALIGGKYIPGSVGKGIAAGSGAYALIGIVNQLRPGTFSISGTGIGRRRIRGINAGRDGRIISDAIGAGRDGRIINDAIGFPMKHDYAVGKVAGYKTGGNDYDSSAEFK